MKYILNNIIEYNSDTGEMLQLDSNIDIAKFTPILNRIFRILIENNNMIIPREELLKQVWDEHGLNASVNTLNQYISTLRKLLHQHLDIENAILNIPKKGIIISSEIVITLVENQNHIQYDITDDNSDKQEGNTANLVKLEMTNIDFSHEVELSKANNQIKISYGSFLLKIAISIICFLVFILIYNLFFNVLVFKEINVYHMDNIDSCPVYTFKDSYDKEVDSSIIDQHLVEFDLMCTDGATFYYYNNYESSGTDKSSILVQCERNKKCITSRINK